MERNFEFRHRMRERFRPLKRSDSVPTASSVQVTEDFAIVVSQNCGTVLLKAAEDLRDYLFYAQEVSVAIKRSLCPASTANTIVVATAEQMGVDWTEAPTKASCVQTCKDGGIVICGFDERGCAQGCYRLEDAFSANGGAWVEEGKIFRAPKFSPRMVHSGYGLDQYPDVHLRNIAYAGMDAILIFVKGVDQIPAGYVDFNDLIDRAADYGIDVYAYSYMKSTVHPEDPGAEEAFEHTYGELFRRCPGFKGVVLVGESVQFPSHDPHVVQTEEEKNATGKPTPGWYPCYDYPQWLKMLQKVVYQYRPDADIVFWTYNWGNRSVEERLKLIDALPEGISLMATFEMFDTRTVDGLSIWATDYTLSFVGPGPYFRTEAERAAQRGIRLYAQASSAGLSWDFGVIPYEPFPRQWAKRYEALLDSHDKHGLCGLMESHHYGFWPSFISSLETRMLTEPCQSADTAMEALASQLYGKANAPKALEAWEHISKAITYYPSTNEDQYGPMRIGPAYPLIFRADVKIPTVDYAHFGGNKICFTDYGSDYLYHITNLYYDSVEPTQLRLPKEISCLEKLRGCLETGRAMLEDILPSLAGWRLEEAQRLIGLVRFIENTATTAIHTKQWNLLRWQAKTESDPQTLLDNLHKMIEIGRKEIANAEATIPLVEADSRLGWEPSMEYIGDAEHLRWKIEQTTRVIEMEIPHNILQIHNACGV